MNPWHQQPSEPNWGPPPGPPPQPYGHQPYPQQPYPQQPYPQAAQPYPGQQYPYAQAGYPPPGYPQYPGYPPPPQRPPSSGSAVTAIVLGIVIALFQLLASVGYFALSSDLSSAGNAAEDWVPGYLMVNGVARLVAAAAIATGAILLSMRKAAGRWTIAGAAIAFVVLQFVEYVARSAADLSTSGASALSTVISVILPIAVIVLALNNATRRWMEHGRRPY